MSDRELAANGANQPPVFTDVNLFSSDAVLQDAVAREGGGHATRILNGLGLDAGSAEAFGRGMAANAHPPTLRSHDVRGERCDLIEYHPAWHALVEAGMRAGLHCGSWLHLAPQTTDAARSGANVIRAAGLYMAAQTEPGHCGPLITTNAAIAALTSTSEVAGEWLPRLLQRSYDPRPRPPAEKASCLAGIALSERQGQASELMAATTARAVTGEEPGAEYFLDGAKWFVSSPMTDALVVLAQTTAGPSLFWLPRLDGQGARNGIAVERLKDKLGNRANATAEMTLTQARARLLGAPGQGRAVLETMQGYLRLDVAIISTGLMRLAVAEAIHFAEHRSTGRRRLADEPLMSHVLADLALDVEAAAALVFRSARALDCANDARATAWSRLMIPVTRYWLARIAPGLLAEAMECLGGVGGLEDRPMARAYREAPMLAMLETTGNAIAHELLTMLQREPSVVASIVDELGLLSADDTHLRAAHARLERMLADPRRLEGRARALAEAMALLAAGTILRAHAPSFVAEAYLGSRLAASRTFSYGQDLDWAATRDIVARASPNRPSP